MNEPSKAPEWELPTQIEDRGRLPPRHLPLGAGLDAEDSDREGLVHKGMTFQDFLAFEERSERKHEYIEGNVYAMAGADDAHNTIALNISALLHAAVRGSPCRVYMSDMALRVDSDEKYFYPDVMVTCSPSDATLDQKREPTVLIEVLSKSTATRDRREKKDCYLSIPSLRQYWLVSKDRFHIEVYRRLNKKWVSNSFSALESAIDVPELNAELRLEDIYENVPGR